MKYGITAATGHFGQVAVKELVGLVGADNVVAIVRNLEKAKQLLSDDIEIRQGDYDDKNSLVSAFEGLDKVLFISSQPGGKIIRLEQHTNVVDALKETKVDFVAYTSFPHADQAKSALASDHTATEKLIVESGIKHSFLRNNWYLENEAGFLNGEDIVYAAGDGKVGWALEREYAEGAVKVLVSDETKDVYEFAGASRSYADLAKAVGEVYGKEIAVTNVASDDYKAGLEKAGLDENPIGFILMIQDLIKQGELTEETSDLVDVLGHELKALPEAIKEVIGR